MTSQSQSVKVKCRFARAGFSHERKFMIEAPEDGYYTGTAFIGYCFKTDESSLPDEDPPIGEVMDGLLEARILRRSGDTATISVPDGGVCDISIDLILEKDTAADS
jgi:hypothetical protein